MNQTPAIPKYTKISLIVMCVLLSIPYILLMLDGDPWIFGLSSDELLPILYLSALGFLLSGLIVLAHRHVKHKKRTVFISSAVSLLIMTYLIWLTVTCPPLPTASKTTFVFTSDDKKHEIIVNEYEYPGPFGYIYEKNSFCTMKCVGSYSADDKFLPFAENRFYFVWNEDNFELHYDYDGTGEYKVVRMDYAK